ncbi:MAG: O-antigen ligase family protein, partial [Acidimicrobiia bacterium]
AVFLTFVGTEFGSEGWPLWYQTDVMGVPLQYLVFALLVALLWPVMRTRPRVNVVETLRESRVWLWVVLGWVTLMVALVIAVLRQADEPFADWRNWVVLAGAAVVVAKLLSDRSWRTHALTDLTIGYGALATIHLVIWMAGGGTRLFDLRVPLTDGYDLSLAVLAAAVAAEAWIRGFPGMKTAYSIALRLSFLTSTALVMLSFRRSLWAFVVLALIGVAIWGYRAGGSRRIVAIRLSIALGALLVIAVVSLGPERVVERLESFNPTATNNYTATNQDHVNDLRDALSVIQREPLLALGIGSTYQTELIAEWKSESFEVHNAFIHSWLKFGLLGLITYIGFHIALGRAFLRLGSKGVTGFMAAGVIVFAEQVVSLVQTWPYGGFGYTLGRGIVLGIFLACWSRASSGETVTGDDRLSLPVAAV